MLTTYRIKEITHELAEKTCKILGVFNVQLKRKNYLFILNQQPKKRLNLFIIN